MVNALEAGTIVAVMAGVTGWFMVLRRQTFAGHTLSVIAFPGAAAASARRACRSRSATSASAGSARSRSPESPARGRSLSTESAAIGSLQALALALGFLFVSLYTACSTASTRSCSAPSSGSRAAQVQSCCSRSRVAAVALIAVSARPLLFASVDAGRRPRAGVPVRPARPRLPARCSGSPSRRRARSPARCSSSPCSSRRRPPRTRSPRDRSSGGALGRDRARRHLARARARVLLGLPGRLLRHARSPSRSTSRARRGSLAARAHAVAARAAGAPA